MHVDRAFARQSGFSVRLDWGEAGLARLAPEVDLIVIVDVLSLSTAVDTAALDTSDTVPVLARQGF